MSTSTPTPNLHIYFVLDRSGSMQSIANDVIGGFNAYLKQQQADGNDAVMTLIQFDSQDRHEVIAAAQPIGKIKPLSKAVFVPRGGTPLYDAMGQVLNEAISREAQLVGAEKPAESIVFVTFTDGEENDSREFSGETVLNLVKGKEKDGWTFVYMGANQDAYATGGEMGVSQMNSSNFIADKQGTKLAFEDLARSTSKRRTKLRTGEVFASGAFFEEGKTADQDAGERL
ncbi:MAG: VWA domain-containing protein [Actinobacteria bacterium]|nr:VWA domain-containing protein [Actinomycetota bacterium]